MIPSAFYSIALRTLWHSPSSLWCTVIKAHFHCLNFIFYIHLNWKVALRLVVFFCVFKSSFRNVHTLLYTFLSHYNHVSWEYKKQMLQRGVSVMVFGNVNLKTREALDNSMITFGQTLYVHFCIVDVLMCLCSCYMSVWSKFRS